MASRWKVNQAPPTFWKVPETSLPVDFKRFFQRFPGSFPDFPGSSPGRLTPLYFLSSPRAQTAKTLICTKSGVSADSRKSAKKCGEPGKLGKTAEIPRSDPRNWEIIAKIAKFRSGFPLSSPFSGLREGMRNLAKFSYFWGVSASESSRPL